MLEKSTLPITSTDWAAQADQSNSYALQIKQEQDPLLAQLYSGTLANTPWDYHRQSHRYGLHGLIKYPAMMVPKMQGDLLDAAIQADPTITEVFDPFVGAGTTLVESLARGLNFTGVDINPLAILACQAKSGPFFEQAYAQKITALLLRISQDRGRTIDVDFPERRKWFSTSASLQLSRIRRAIRCEPSLWARRLMWLAFAETVRAVSNSRGSTYKLHIQPQEKLAEIPHAIDHFHEKAHDSVARISWHTKELESRGILRKGRVPQSINILCNNMIDFSKCRTAFADILITSPPYGDNESTVPYGQFSYLQLRWIDEKDLPGKSSVFPNAYAIDGQSLGGSRRKSLEHTEHLSAVSNAAGNFIESLAAVHRKDLMRKALAFLRDYERALMNASALLRPGGYAIWTIGDRTVGGVRLPLGEITADILECSGMSEQGYLKRTIPQKRTPQRNSQGSTMNEEQVLITKKLAR